MKKQVQNESIKQGMGKQKQEMVLKEQLKKVKDVRKQKRDLEQEYERLCFDVEAKRNEIEETEDKLGRQKKKRGLKEQQRKDDSILKPPSSEQQFDAQEDYQADAEMAKGEIQEVNQSIEKQTQEEAATKIQKFVRKKQQKQKREEKQKVEMGSSPGVFKTEVPQKKQEGGGGRQARKPNFNKKW